MTENEKGNCEQIRFIYRKSNIDYVKKYIVLGVVELKVNTHQTCPVLETNLDHAVEEDRD